MKINLVALALTAIIFAACNQKEKAPKGGAPHVVGLHTPTSAKALVASNVYITLDTTKAKNSANLTKDEKAMAKAAVYRFYKHVKLTDGLYSTSLKNAGEINVSEGLFKLLADDLDKTNLTLAKEKAKGLTYERPPIDDKYLNTLLQ